MILDEEREMAEPDRMYQRHNMRLRIEATVLFLASISPRRWAFRTD